MGLTQRDVTSSMLISLSGSGTVAPNFWMNWTNGINYNIGVQTPQYRIDSLDALLRTPISASNAPVNSTTAGSQAGAGGGHRLHRRVAERRVAGLRKSRSRCGQHAASLEPGLGSAFLHAGDRQPLQRLAGLRRVCQRGPAGSGRRGRGSPEDHARGRGRICRAAPRSISAGRSRPCNRPSSGWAWG